MSFPKALECPISYEIMKNAVIAPDGYTYDRDNIIKCLRQKAVSPFTNIPMNISDLVPNRAIQDQIDEFMKTYNKTETNIVIPTFTNAPYQLSANKNPGPAGSWMLDIEVKIPEYGERQGIIMILGVDASGSMDTVACDINETGGKAFTRMDLVKYTLMTISNMLNEKDMLCIIRFSNNASVTLTPTLMNAEGIIKAQKAIKSLRPDGSTNIWDCLLMINSIASKPEFKNKNIVSALLTDGEANIRPPRGEIDSFKMLSRPDTFSSFGFGYTLDSKLLSELSTIGGGSFGFIPDYSMVGTVFINWCSSVLATGSLNQEIIVTYANGSTSKHSTGLIQYGQTRNITLQTEFEPVNINNVIPTTDAINDFSMTRFSIINHIKYCIGHEGTATYNSLYDKYKNSTNPIIKELIRDIKPMGNDDEGQISMAPRYWEKWGKHYTRAYLTAQQLQNCMNFKDPGLQIYGGKLFHELQAIGDKIFCELPALEPTGHGYQSSYVAPAPAPVNMAQVFYNTGGGCWAPGTMIRMADNKYMEIENIRKGMYVWTVSGPALVEYALVLGSKNQTQVMCQVGKLWITPWHPILINNEWKHPETITPMVNRIMPIVYNLILDRGYIIEADDIQTVTLGHGLKGNIIEHDFFGNKQKILDDLKDLPGFNDCRPVFTNLKVKKDPVTGFITGWYNDD